MSELGKIFNDWNKIKKEKKVDNSQKSIRILIKNNIEFKTLESSIPHLRIGDYDFWPSTGKFFNRKTNFVGRGVFNLINKLETQLKSERL